MRNLNVQEKSRGALIFAFNTDNVDYVSISENAAKLILHNLDIPVTLVTDSKVKSKYFNSVVTVNNKFRNTRVGYKHSEKWRNGNRYQAYELSPYESTMLIDSDYLTLDKSMLKILESTQDYRLMHHNQNPQQSMSGNMGPLSLDFVWATVVCFNKTPKSKALFDLVGRIQRNYQYYRLLYQLRETNFRNDYAFAIANHVLSGHTSEKEQSIPWTMLTIDQPIKDIVINEKNLVIREQEQAHIVSKQNLHIMDKDFLLSDTFNNFVKNICQENS